MNTSNSEKNNFTFEILDLQEYLGLRENYISISNRCLTNQVIILKEGSGKFWKNSNQISIKEKCIFIYLEDQVQIFEKLKNIKGYVYILKNISLFSNSYDDEKLNFFNLVETVFLQSQIFPDKLLFDEILEITEKIEKEKKSNNSKFQNSIIVSLLQITLIKLFQSISVNSIAEKKYNSDLEVLYKFKKLLEENYNTEKSASFYSSNLFISLKKLNSIFKKHFNKTAKQLIEEKILIETKKNLLHSNLTIKEISYKVGFNDPTNFNKFFKRNTSYTPLEFRSNNIL